jgi:hypothetical protein
MKWSWELKWRGQQRSLVDNLFEFGEFSALKNIVQLR